MSGAPAELGICLATTAAQPGGVWRHLCDLADGITAAGLPLRFDLPPGAAALRADAVRRGYRVNGEPFDREVFHAHLGHTYDVALTRRLPGLRARGRRIVLTEHLPRTDASDVALAVRPPRPGATAAKTALKRLQLGMVDHVIAVSQGSADFLTARYGRSSKIRVIPNGVDVADVEPAPLPRREPGDVRFVALGSVIAQKGFDLLIEAGRRAERPWVVDVWGEGPHRVELDRAAADLRLADGRRRVRFRGWTDDSVSEVLAADGVVMPSRWEAWPYTALEAMAAGRPLVATRVDGLAEIVQDGVTGLLVDPDPAALAAALDRLTDAPARRQEMGVAGHRRVRTHFTARAMVSATLEVYQSCFATRPQVATVAS